jgi:hypothetical protein
LGLMEKADLNVGGILLPKGFKLAAKKNFQRS